MHRQRLRPRSDIGSQGAQIGIEVPGIAVNRRDPSASGKYRYMRPEFRASNNAVAVFQRLEIIFAHAPASCGFRRYRPPTPIINRPRGPIIIRPPSPIIDRPCCRRPSGSYFTVFGIGVVVKRRGLARASFAGSRRIIRGGRRCEECGRGSRRPEWDYRSARTSDPRGVGW